MNENKWNTALAHDVTESLLKTVKITGIMTSLIPDMHSPIKRCPLCNIIQFWSNYDIIYNICAHFCTKVVLVIPKHA